MKLLLLLSTLLLAIANRSCEESVDQGLAGQVRWLEGNLMPTIGEDVEQNQKDYKGEPVQREVHIYELTSMDEATAEGTFFKNIQTDLVKKVETNEEGEFIVELPVGRYSVFVQEDQGLFANSFDGEGHINPVEIKEGELTKITIQINYKAAY